MGGGQSVIPSLVNTAIFLFTIGHDRVIGQDNSEHMHVAILMYNELKSEPYLAVGNEGEDYA